MIRIMIYALSEFLSKFSMFLLFPIVAKYLSAGDLGSFSLLFPFLQNFQLVLTFGMTIGISSFFFQKEHNNSTVIFNAGFIWLILTILFSCAGFGIIKAAYPQYLKWFFPSLTFLVGMSVTLIAAQLYQLEKKAFSFVLMNNGAKVIMVAGVITIAAVYKKNMTLYDVVTTMAATGVFFGIIGIYTILKRVTHCKVSLIYVKQLLSVGSPLMVSGVVTYFTVVSGRIVLVGVASLSDVGLFTIVQSIAGITSLFFAIISRIVGVENYKRVAGNTLDDSYINFTFSKMSVYLVMFILLSSIAAKPILIFIGHYELMPYVLVLLGGFYFQLYYAVLVDIIYARRKMYYITATNILSVIMNLGLTYIGFIKIGILGAVLAQIVSIIFVSTTVVTLIYFYEKIKPNLIPLGFPLVTMLVGLITVNFIRQSYILLGVAAVVIIVFTMFRLYEDRHEIRNFYG